MHFPCKSWISGGISGLLAVMLLSLTLVAQEAPTGESASPENQYREQLRELGRLREQIERLLQEADRAAKPAPAAKPSPAVPPAPVVQPAPAASEDVPAITLERVGVYGGGFAFNLTIGWEFQPTARIEVTELGIWDTDGNGLDVETPIAIWDAAGKVVISAQLPAGTEARLVDRFRYVKIKPIALEPGQRYVIAALYTPQTKDQVIHNGGAKLSIAAPIQWVSTRRGKTEELALPEKSPAKTPEDERPGGFGPNFLMAKSAATSAARHATGVPGSERVPTIHLYALPQGELTQIMLNDTPLGSGSDAFASLANELHRFKLVARPDQSRVRVAAMPGVKARDLQTVFGITETGRYNPRDTRRIVRGGAFGSLAAARLHQPQRDGEFVEANRFRDAGDYIEDRWTGLLWQKDGAVSGKKNYYEARDYAAQLKLDGLGGWRVPSVEELATIFPATYTPFTHTQYNANQCCEGPAEYPSYWTSELDHSQPDYAYVFQWYADGGANNCYASRNRAYVRCVRDRRESSSQD